MKLRTAFPSAASVVLLVVVFVAAAAGLTAASAVFKPNFTGTWELDQTRSHSLPPDIKQTMTVAHEGDKVNVETKIISAQGERIIKDAYTLDGKEADFTPPPPPQPQQPAANVPAPKGKRAARWLPNGKGFVVEEVVTNETPQGKSVTNFARKWMLWPDGTLSVEIQTESERGSFSSKRVFTKTAAAK